MYFDSFFFSFMGKIGGSSWLRVVKRAFRSPTKEASHEKSSSRRREEHAEQEEEEKVPFCVCVHLLVILV